MADENMAGEHLPFVPRVLPGSDAGEFPPGFETLRLAMPESGRVLDLNRPEMVAGRHSQADIYLPHPEVSRRHCRFLFHDGVWTVEDRNSLNGLYVNHEKVTHHLLRLGDAIQIGVFTLVVQESAARDADATAVLRSIADAFPAERRKAS
jgi:pSer/pThr/pTyr-binding forkhead associated (FHA) protein